jgi:hypothetical protein
MMNAGGMGVTKGSSNSEPDADNLRLRQWPSVANPLMERTERQVLHHEVADANVGALGLVERDDTGMVGKPTRGRTLSCKRLPRAVVTNAWL